MTGDEGDDSFLEPKKESKKAALRRKSQADMAGRRHCRPAPAAGKNLNRSVWSKAPIGRFFIFPLWSGFASPRRLKSACRGGVD